MREIKYRGKAVMTKHELDYLDIPNYKGWIKGSLIVDWSDYYIVGPVIEASDDGLIHEWWAKVHPESVGQSTGLKDKNGKEIYEGDIVNSVVDGMESVDQVIYKGSGFYIKSQDDDLEDEPLHEADELIVIGNIYENPEILEQHHD